LLTGVVNASVTAATFVKFLKKTSVLLLLNSEMQNRF